MSLGWKGAVYDTLPECKALKRPSDRGVKVGDGRSHPIRVDFTMPFLRFVSLLDPPADPSSARSHISSSPIHFIPLHPIPSQHHTQPQPQVHLTIQRTQP